MTGSETVTTTKTRTKLLLAGSAFIAFMGMVEQAQAQNGSVVMRRPLPKDARGVIAPDPTVPADPNDPTTPSEQTKAPDPIKEVCDKATSAGAYITDVSWIEGPRAVTNGSACTATSYVCQATYACAVNGVTTNFTSEAPDDVCEDFDGKVAYPTGKDPSADTANRFIRAGRIAYDATATMMAVPTSSQELGLAGYDFGPNGSDYGPEVANNTQYYFARVSGDETCKEINKAFGVNGIEPVEGTKHQELCVNYPTGNLYYQRRIDTAQSARQAAYVMSIGATAKRNADVGADTSTSTTLGLDGFERYNLIKDAGVSDVSGGNRAVWIQLGSYAACMAIDRSVNGSRPLVDGRLPSYSPQTMAEGCGASGWASSAYYWKQIGRNILPDMTCTQPYAYQRVTGIRTQMVEGQPGTVLPSKLCWGSDVSAPRGDRHLFVQEDGNVVMYNNPGQSGAAWASGTQYTGIRMVAMADDGNLAAYDAQGNVRWQTNTRGNPGAYAVFISTGNLVVLSNAGKMLWESRSATYDAENTSEGTVKDAQNLPAAVVPTKLYRRQFVMSPNGKHKLEMQADDHLVLYSNGGAKWASQTQYTGAAVLVTETSGILRLLATDGSQKWTAGAPGVPGSRLRLRNDGNLVLVAPDGRIVWQTNTSDGTVATIVAG